MKIIDSPSPNYDTRGGAMVDTLVLHYTGMQSGAEALERLCDAAAKVSAHYLIEEDGRVFQMVDEADRAWHAGVAIWRGQSNINARSIGVEIVNPGHEWGYREFPKAQMEAVAELCKGILSRHAILARNVIGHSDVAPARKQDPGELFPWEWIANQGVGLFPVPYKATAKSQRKLPPQFIAAEVRENLTEKLASYGYGVDLATPKQIISAFQRHFRPEMVTGMWDDACEERLNWLLASCEGQ